MRLNAFIDGEQHDVDINVEGSRVIAEFEGRRYEVAVNSLGEGRSLLIHEHRVFDCQVLMRDSRSEALEIRIGNSIQKVILQDPKRLRGSHGSASPEEGSAQILAPMPGKVVRILVEAGSMVEEGQGVVVVEAMKMQNEMKSPRSGVVAILNATEGLAVNAGDVLAVIE